MFALGLGLALVLRLGLATGMAWAWVWAWAWDWVFGPPAATHPHLLFKSPAPPLITAAAWQSEFQFAGL